MLVEDLDLLLEALLEFLLVGCEGESFLVPTRDVRVLDESRAHEDARDRVVVGGRDGIELVIMATCATDRHSEEGTTDCVQLLIDDLKFQEFLVLVLVVVWSEKEEPRSGKITQSGRGTDGEEISGDLLANDLVQGAIFGEGLNDVIPITPGIGRGMARPPPVESA